MELPKTNDDVLIALGAKVKETNSDNFYVRIERKSPTGPEALTYCEEAELVHLAKPEDWLSSIFGGGFFILTVFHSSERTMPLGRLLYNFKGQPQMNWPVLDSPTWAGPKKVSRPAVDAQGQTFAEVADEPRGRWGGTSRMQQGYGGFPPPSFQPPATSPVMEKLLETMRADAAARDRQLAEARSQDREMFTRLFDKMSQPQPKLLDGTTLAALITAGTGIITTLVASSEKARAEQQRLAAEQTKETREMMKAITAPRSIDPVIENILKDQRKLIEKIGDQGNNENEAMAQSMQVMQQMFGFTTKAISVAAEAQLNNGKSENPILLALREFVPAIQQIIAARAQEPKRIAPAQNGAVTKPQAQPAQLAEAPVQAAANTVKPDAHPAVQIDEPTSVDRIFESLIAGENPAVLASQIVQLARTEDPAFMAEMAAHNENLIEVAEARLGGLQDNGGLWVLQPKNQVYVRTLMAEIERQGVGIFTDGEEIGEPEDVTPDVAAKPASTTPTAVQ